MKLNQIKADVTEELELARAVNFSDLAKSAQLQAHFSQLQSQYTNYFNILFFNGKNLYFVISSGVI